MKSIIPMEGIEAKSYIAPKTIQDAYITNKYWNKFPDFKLASSKADIQAIRENSKANGIDLSQMSDSEITAIRQYTTRAYIPLNVGLRSGGNQAKLLDSASIISKNTQRPPPQMIDVDVFGRTLLSALNKLPPYKGIVYRGEGLDRIHSFIKMKPGEQWIEAAPFSTTYDPTAAFPKPLQFELELETGVQIDAVSIIPEEFEVLVKPGTKFEIISIAKDCSTDSFLIKAKEIK